jgi:serine/threonine protein kinase
MVLKLADFGLAVNLREERAVTRVGELCVALILLRWTTRTCRTTCTHPPIHPPPSLGTLDYMPPEVLRCPLKRHPGDNKDRKDLQYASAVDAWAVGVLAYELLTGRWVRVMAGRRTQASSTGVPCA